MKSLAFFAYRLEAQRLFEQVGNGVLQIRAGQAHDVMRRIALRIEIDHQRLQPPAALIAARLAVIVDGPRHLS